MAREAMVSSRKKGEDMECPQGIFKYWRSVTLKEIRERKNSGQGSSPRETLEYYGNEGNARYEPHEGCMAALSAHLQVARYRCT